MKVLLLSVALLFFTGAQGRYFWQHDEPQQEKTSDKPMMKILHDGAKILANVIKQFDYKEFAKEYQIKEKLEAAKKNAQKVEDVLEGYFEDIWKKFDAQLHEKFPTFRGSVVPILQKFDDTLEDHLKKVVTEVVPVGSELIAGVSKNMMHFLKNLGGIAEKSRDTLRTEIDNLRVKLQPYVEGVHAEYEKYRASIQSGIEKDVHQMRQNLEANLEELREQAKPYIEEVRKQFEDDKEMQERLERVLKDMQETFAVSQ